jgi:hypothetical protein
MADLEVVVAKLSRIEEAKEAFDNEVQAAQSFFSNACTQYSNMLESAINNFKDAFQASPTPGDATPQFGKVA